MIAFIYDTFYNVYLAHLYACLYDKCLPLFTLKLILINLDICFCGTCS